MRSAVIYPYDRAARPGLIGVDFDSDNANETYTKRFESDDIEDLKTMFKEIVEWITPDLKPAPPLPK